MQKAGKHLLAVGGRILFIGFSVQIVLGMLWLCCSFAGFQQFKESLYYIEVSKSLLCDEYTGILYPALLMPVRGIGDVLHIPYTYIIYFLQLAAALYAGRRLVGAIGVGGRFWRVWASLALLTYPMALQCHLAILPNSLTSSAFLLEIAFLAEAVKREGGSARRVAGMNVFWLLAALLMPDYLWLGAMPVALLFICHCRKKWKKSKKEILNHAILIIAFCGMIAGINGLTQQTGVLGRPEKSISSALFHRITWTSLTNYYGKWTEEMQAVCTPEEVAEMGKYPERLGTIFQARLEQSVGKARAHEIYWDFAKYVLVSNRIEVLYCMALDAAGYAFPPLALQYLLTGGGYESRAGSSYELMRQEAPALTRIYVDYSCWWFAAGICNMLVLAAAAGLMQLVKEAVAGKGFYRQLKHFLAGGFFGISCIVCAVGMIIWYTLSGAGIWDYKNGLFVGQLWLLAMLAVMWRCGMTVKMD